MRPVYRLACTIPSAAYTLSKPSAPLQVATSDTRADDAVDSSHVEHPVDESDQLSVHEWVDTERLGVHMPETHPMYDEIPVSLTS